MVISFKNPAPMGEDRSGVAEVARYIARQEEHHRNRSFSEELKLLVERYGLKWHEDETVETVPSTTVATAPR
jgi:hypothetical protein